MTVDYTACLASEILLFGTVLKFIYLFTSTYYYAVFYGFLESVVVNAQRLRFLHLAVIGVNIVISDVSLLCASES